MILIRIRCKCGRIIGEVHEAGADRIQVVFKGRVPADETRQTFVTSDRRAPSQADPRRLPSGTMHSFTFTCSRGEGHPSNFRIDVNSHDIAPYLSFARRTAEPVTMRYTAGTLRPQ